MGKLPNFQYTGKIFGGGLYWVISNTMFRSFLVRILIQKDNTHDKVLENKFYIKERKDNLERIKCHKCVVICRNLSVRERLVNKAL